MKRKYCAFLIIFCSVFKVISAQNYDSVIIQTTKITDKIYMLHGSGGNIAVLIGEDGIVMVDDQFAPLTEKINKSLSLLTTKPVRFIINTHFHFDHTGGNENFGGEGAIIVSHHNSRLRMTTDQFIESFKVDQKKAPTAALPKVTFTESLTLHLNVETLVVHHIKNAHTDGDVILHFKESNVFHAGDIFVRYGLPFIDQPNGGTIDGMIRGIDFLIKLADNNSRIIPGHGDLSTKQDLLDYKIMLEKVRSLIGDKIKQGTSLNELIAGDILKDYPAAFPRELFVKSVYDSIKK